MQAPVAEICPAFKVKQISPGGQSQNVLQRCSGYKQLIVVKH